MSHHEWTWQAAWMAACSVLGAVCIGAASAQTAAPADPRAGLRTDDAMLRPPTAPVPAWNRPFTDPVFGTRITRITDPTQVPGASRVRHYYSKSQPFNADGTRAVFFASDGSVILYDAARWLPLGALRIQSSDPEIQWDVRDPDVLYHLDFAGGSPDVRALYRYDVRTGQRSLLRDFPEYDTVRGKLEGNLDRAGRHYALIGKKGGRLEAFVYDLRDNRIGPRIPVTEAMADDWISVTPGGRYVVLMGKDRSRVYDLDMKLLRELPRGSFGHADLCQRADGSEVMVYDGADHQLDDHRNINMADLATGQVVKLVRIGWGTTPHVSCRNVDAPGWALISTQGPDRKYPNRDFEIFWVKLDGSNAVRRVAHHHSDRERDGYFAEQHAVSDRSGRRIVFASNWDGRAPICAYLVESADQPGRGAR